MADQPKTADDVKAFVDDRDIRFVRLWFTDILGQLKSFSINAEELDDAFEGGMGFDGSSITGFNAIEESDMIAMPDPSTFAVLPWRPEDRGVARMFCDVVTPSREPYEGDTRQVLRRTLERVYGEALQLTQDVREPEPDEPDVTVRDEGLDVVGGLRLVGHAAPRGRVGGA